MRIVSLCDSCFYSLFSTLPAASSLVSAIHATDVDQTNTQVYTVESDQVNIVLRHACKSAQLIVTVWVAHVMISVCNYFTSLPEKV